MSMNKFMTGVVEHDEPIADEKTKSNAKSPFAFVDDFSANKTEINSLEELAGYDKFVINRYLSMSPMTIDLALIASKANNLSDLDHYRFMFHTMPNRRIAIKWLNKKGENEIVGAIKDINEVFECGNNDARAMLDLLQPELMKKIGKTAKDFRKLRGDK